ncbi:MAG: Gfo/Idh/MocA family oxidoreductase, partial [Gammaproteobacteria bacterium]
MSYKSLLEIKDRKVRFAIVGCGRIAERHFDAIEEHGERCELVAVCDNDKDTARNCGTRMAVDHYDSLESLLAGSQADI